MDKFEYNGIWWLPENPERRISGILSFHPQEGASLELIGTFKEEFDKIFKLDTLDIILGVTSNGKEVTLYRCYETKSQINSPGLVNSLFTPQVIFMGHHFEKEDDIVFDSLSINYSFLEEWTNITGFQCKIEWDHENHISRDEVSYKFPEKIEAQINGFKISLDFYFRRSGDHIKEVILTHTSFIKIEPEKPIHFSDYQQAICYHLQNFLSLAIGKAIYPVIVKGKSEECKTERPDGTCSYNDIFVYYAIKQLPILSRKFQPFDLLFNFSDISDEFGKYLNNWYSKAEVLKPVYDLYFGTLYNFSMYLEHNFLSLIQAVESYHRRVSGGKYVPDEGFDPVFNNLVQAIPANIDSGFKDSIKMRLKYLNEFSLRKRLKELFSKYGSLFSYVIKDSSQFTEDVLNTRNYLTHYDKESEDNAKTGDDMFRLVQRLKFILEICFLVELEIPMEAIKGIISRNQRYQFLVDE